jgi:hypothetical protein
MKYYLHDSNSFNDEKVSELYLNFGYEGLGLFYTILEKLAFQEKPVKTLVLKHQLNVGKKLEKCWKFMEEIDLISSNNGETFNKQLLNYSEKYKIKKEKNAKRISEWRENQVVTENVTQYESVSNASKVNKSKVNRNKEISLAPAVLSFRNQLFERWFAYKREKKNTYTETGKKVLIDKWANYSDIELEKAIERSISNNWSGLFEEKITQTNPLQTRGKIQAGIENITSATTDLINDIQDGNFHNPFESY